MCGIAGIFHLDQRPCEVSEIRPLIDAIHHRGPDGYGIHTQGPVGLGHRRLAVLDLSDSGKQPLQFADRYWITYNGEVYNFVELRRELERLGERFTTDCDTEIVVAAYRHWGAECVFKFNGMWAFAIWDAERRELFLSRDRFGVKPLHYLAQGKRFVFGSELKCFLRLAGFTATENQDEVRLQLSDGKSTEDTLINGVKQLRPGHNLLVTESGMRIWRWWWTLDHLMKVPKRFDEQVEQFRELFYDACRLRLRSDVPVATCLSGGLDSSSILCSLAAMNKAGGSRLTSDYHRAFVATFEGTSHDERVFAEAAIRKAGAEERYRPMNPAALIEDLPQYAYDFEFVGRGLLLPVWALYREQRRDGVVVSMDGLGADELLAGYGAALRRLAVAHGNLWRAPFRTYDMARVVQGQQPGLEPFPLLLAQCDPVLRLAGRAARQVARRLKGSAPAAKPVASWFARRQDISFEPDEREREAMQSLTPLNRELYREFHDEVNHLLPKYDRLSMAHGVEVRLPFLDWRLACFTFSLPDECKAGGGYTKRVLRAAMQGVLPEEIRTRKSKVGFTAPMRSWMTQSVGQWVWKRVQTKEFLESEVWDGRAIRDFVAARVERNTWAAGDAHRIWPIFQADLWRESFFGAHARARGR